MRVRVRVRVRVRARVRVRVRVRVRGCTAGQMTMVSCALSSCSESSGGKAT